MSKSNADKPGPGVSQNKKKQLPRRDWKRTVIVGALILGLIGMVLPNIISFFSSGAEVISSPATTSAPNSSTSTPSTMPDIQFTKEGELTFLSASGQSLRQIDIEKADNEMERTTGLMFRKNMDDTQGMLFLFEHSEMQSFWMKNTLIPLDILYVDENFTINTIHENTRPMSETSLPSAAPAKFVVEVNGGFCKKYGIKTGDKIRF